MTHSEIIKMDYYVIKTPQGYYDRRGFLKKFTPHLEEATRFLSTSDMNYLNFNVQGNWIKRIKVIESGDFSTTY